MPIIPSPYIQYGGVWTTSQATDAVASGTWAVPPAPHIFTWGANDNGQLGLSNTIKYSSPKQVGSLTTWYAIGEGNQFSLATKTDGTLWSWGFGSLGALGLGNLTQYNSPKQVGALTNWLTVACGAYSSYAIKTDGTFWSWGMNNFGQLGLNSTTYAFSSPNQIGSLATWSKVSAGFYHASAIKTDGTLWTWGYNGQGQLGLGNTTDYSSPKQVGALTDWSKISCGFPQTLAIKTDGTLWSWGGNDVGQLGLGNTTNYSSPKQVGALTNWLNVSAGYSFGIATKTDGTIWVWGNNTTYGMLGLGNTTNYSSPKQIGALTNWSIPYGGYRQSFAIKTDGTLWSWGANVTYGQLGLGNTTNYSSPKQVGSLTTWSDIAVKFTVANAVIGIAKT